MIWDFFSQSPSTVEELWVFVHKEEFSFHLVAVLWGRQKYYYCPFHPCLTVQVIRPGFQWPVIWVELELEQEPSDSRYGALSSSLALLEGPKHSQRIPWGLSRFAVGTKSQRTVASTATGRLRPREVSPQDCFCPWVSCKINFFSGMGTLEWYMGLISFTA